MKSMEKLIYPACFYPCENQKDTYTVIVPDLPGCITEGSSLAEAIEMATDAASGWILDELEEDNPIPKARNIKDVKLNESSGFISLLTLDIDSYAEKNGDKLIRKNLTIPAWLNTFAEKNHLNFSQVLKDALFALFKKKHNLS